MAPLRGAGSERTEGSLVKKNAHTQNEKQSEAAAGSSKLPRTTATQQQYSTTKLP